MRFSLIPERMYSSIFDLTPEDLRKEGIRVVFADLDNTLARYRVRRPSPEVIAWKDTLEAGGVRLFVVSNSRKPTRVTEYCTVLGIDFIGHAGKPKRKGFLRALEQVEASPSEVAMIGDQIFTDILGSNNAGIHSWLITPIQLDTIFRRLRYGFETPFRLLCKDDRRK